jgi:6-pyruvoyltetrahydropterin/6-carboxytetrahydropterin synthase
VIDFSVVKDRVGQWIDEHWDHTTLVNARDTALRSLCEVEHHHTGRRAPYVFDGEPTAENIAMRLLYKASKLLDDVRIRVVSVEVFETPNCSAKVYAERN